MRREINGAVFHPCTGRVVTQKIVSFVAYGWPDRPWNEAATAVRANIPQKFIDTVCAERALVATNSRLPRGRWQGFVAVFAAWSKFEHLDAQVGTSASVLAPAVATQTVPVWTARHT